MPILKKRYKNKFTIIPNAIFTDPNLNMRDVGLLCFLLHLPENWNFTVNGLVAVLPNDGKDCVTRSLKRIEEAGYLSRCRERLSGGRLGAAIWVISDSPMTDFPAQEMPPQEEPPQIRKNSNKDGSEKENNQTETSDFLPELGRGTRDEENFFTSPHLEEDLSAETEAIYGAKETHDAKAFVSRYIRQTYPAVRQRRHPTIHKSLYIVFARRILDCAIALDLPAEDVESALLTALKTDSESDASLFLLTTSSQLSYWLVRAGIVDVPTTRGTPYDYSQIVEKGNTPFDVDKLFYES